MTPPPQSLSLHPSPFALSLLIVPSLCVSLILLLFLSQAFDGSLPLPTSPSQSSPGGLEDEGSTLSRDDQIYGQHG